MEVQDYEKIELRSDDVQEILGTPPSWILRWGSTFVFMGIILLAWVSWILKYPDIIHAPIRITTNVPPVPVVARTTGYLSKLLVKEGDTVKQGDLLVVLQNPANYEDILRLENELHEFDSLSEVNVRLFKPSMNLVLGDLQLNYSSFVQILKDFQFKKESNFTEQSIKQYQQQIQNTQRLKRSEKDKLLTTTKNLEIVKQQFARKQTLYSQNVIPKAELEEARKDILNAEQAIKLHGSNLEELDGRILQLEKNILDIEQNNSTTNSTQFNSLVESINQLRTAIAKWKQTFLLSAPTGGKISFFNNFWAENQDIREGAEVMAIVPPNGNDIVGFVELQSSGSGKVKENQRVVIKFDSYPYQEYGIVDGIVLSKALLPKNDKAISVRVKLTNGLKTSYHKELKFEQQMQGVAEIITEERRFIERMFDKLISAYKNR